MRPKKTPALWASQARESLGLDPGNCVTQMHSGPSACLPAVPPTPQYKERDSPPPAEPEEWRRGLGIPLSNWLRIPLGLLGTRKMDVALPCGRWNE